MNFSSNRLFLKVKIKALNYSTTAITNLCTVMQYVLVVVDFKKLTYTITKYAPWGIVGAATITGWGDKPDQKFTYDLSTETWFIKGIVLKADQFKFRLGDDWGTNYGTTAAAAQAIGTSGGLKSGGENFIATPGTYDFELNLKDAANPTYKATKVK